MAEIVFDHLVLAASETVPSKAIRNTGNAYIVDVRWLGRMPTGSAGMRFRLQGSNDREHWDTLTTSDLVIGATSAAPSRHVFRLAPAGTVPPIVDLADAYDSVRLQVTNDDSGSTQLLSATLDITRYNT